MLASIGQIFGNRSTKPNKSGYMPVYASYTNVYGGERVDEQTGKWDRDKSNHHQYRRNE